MTGLLGLACYLEARYITQTKAELVSEGRSENRSGVGN